MSTFATVDNATTRSGADRALPSSRVAGSRYLPWRVERIIGFIALAGVGAQTGVIMLLYLDHAWNARLEERSAEGAKPTRQDLRDAIEFGAVERLRPKMMTVAAVTLSLVPILWSQQTGSDVLKRIAAPMVGGLITSAALTLIVLPAIYLLWRERQLSR